MENIYLTNSYQNNEFNFNFEKYILINFNKKNIFLILFILLNLSFLINYIYQKFFFFT